VGGYDWYSEPAQSKRNRVIEPVQPGSAFKPVIYTAAFEKGYSPSTKVSNEPLTISLPNGKPWSPKNYTGEYGGHYQLRKALIKSLNIPTVRIFETLVGRVYQHDSYYGRQSLEIAKRMGIKAYIPKELSIALGTANITPLEMATAYSVFANNGTLVEPYAIEWIDSRDGDRLYVHLPSGKENVIDPVHSFLITDILTGVIREQAGTAYLLAHDFPFPIAGKTGTTNEYYDAWFVGYSKNLVAALWIGHDRWTSLGGQRSGGKVALPPWLEFMGKAIPHHLETHLGVSKEEIAGASGKATLAEDTFGFEKPEGGLHKIEVCSYSLLKPNAYCKTTTIWVKEGDEPWGVCKDCGIEYVDAPAAEPVPLFPSQAPSLSGARPHRPVRRLEPLPIAPPDPPSIDPNVEIQNTRGLDLRSPYLPWGDSPSVEPAVPRPLLPSRPTQ
jgi:membrane peptidoglycan carboxypeptidase